MAWLAGQIHRPIISARLLLIYFSQTSTIYLHIYIYILCICIYITILLFNFFLYMQISLVEIILLLLWVLMWTRYIGHMLKDILGSKYLYLLLASISNLYYDLNCRLCVCVCVWIWLDCLSPLIIDQIMYKAYTKLK